MSTPDLSNGAEPAATTTATPDNDPASTAAEPTGEATDTSTEEAVELSDDELISELSTEAPQPAEDSEAKAIEQDRRQNGRMVRAIAAYNRVKKAVDDGAELEDAIKEEKTHLQGAVKKMFNGEDPFEEEPQDPHKIAEQIAQQREEEANYKRIFAEIAKENGIHTDTTTSLEKRKQLNAEVEALVKNPSKARLVRLVAAHMFGQPKPKPKGAMAATVQPSKVKTVGKDAFAGLTPTR